MYSASSATSQVIVSVTAKKMYVPVDGSTLTKADLVGSVHNQNPANARTVAALNTLLEIVLTSLHVPAEAGMLLFFCGVKLC